MSHNPTSEYREFRPAPPLAPFVVCTWTQRVGEGELPYRQRVMPDGCVDVVWNEETPPVVVGPATRTFVVPLRPRTTCIGVRFRPGLAPVLLGAPVGPARDREVLLVDLWGPAAKLLAEQIAEGKSTRARIKQVETALRERLHRARPADEVVVAAVAWMARHSTGRIAQLSRSIGISSRQLHRRFNDAVGYSPKTLQRILRFQRVLDLARNEYSARLDLAALAFEAGYSDQAHMSREVRELSDLTPTSLLKDADSALAMAGLFTTATDASPPLPFD